MCALFTGKNNIKLQEVDSTNTYMFNLIASQYVAEGMVVQTNFQTNGKGQRGNTWIAEKDKNLLFTIYYTPTFLPAIKQFTLTQAIALGVFDFLSRYSNEVSIKWPNDLYIGDLKVAGMLIENTLKGESMSDAIIGIGINVNQLEFGDNLSKATSLKQATGNHFNLSESLDALLSAIELRYLQLRNNQVKTIHENYLEVLYLFQKEHLFTLPNGEKLQAKISCIDEYGRLQLTTEKGELKTFAIKEIIF